MHTSPILLNSSQTKLIKEQSDREIQTAMGLIENEPDFIVGKNINEVIKENLDNYHLKQMLNNICVNQEPRFYKKTCRDCNGDFEHDDEGKPITYQYFCENPFCKSEDCFTYRQRIFKKLLTGFFNFYPAWRNKRNNRWVHFSIGAERQSLPTRKELININKRVKAFVKDYNETFSILRGCYIRDFSYDQIKEGEEWFIHFHFAVRPMKQEQFIEIQNLAIKHKLLYNYIGFRKSENLINYFAKRCAGKFGHEQFKTNFMFADVLTSQEYFDIFHRSRKIYFTGLKQGEIKRLRNCLEEILHKCEAFVLVNTELPTNRRTTCQHCGSKLFLKQEIKLEERKPPPNEIKRDQYSGFEIIKLVAQSKND